MRQDSLASRRRQPARAVTAIDALFGTSAANSVIVGLIGLTRTFSLIPSAAAAVTAAILRVPHIAGSPTARLITSFVFQVSTATGALS